MLASIVCLLFGCLFRNEKGEERGERERRSETARRQERRKNEMNSSFVSLRSHRVISCAVMSCGGSVAPEVGARVRIHEPMQFVSTTKQVLGLRQLSLQCLSLNVLHSSSALFALFSFATTSPSAGAASPDRGQSRVVTGEAEEKAAINEAPVLCNAHNKRFLFAKWDKFTLSFDKVHIRRKTSAGATTSAGTSETGKGKGGKNWAKSETI